MKKQSKTAASVEDYNKSVLRAVEIMMGEFMPTVTEQESGDEIDEWIITTFGKLGAGIFEIEVSEKECVCGSKDNIKKRRLNTSYADDNSNWLVSCKDCYDEAFSYYQDLWEEYYASRF